MATTPLDLDDGSSARPARFRWRSLVDHMANDIQAGRLASGAWLKQVDVEERYGFSRGDVRKALDELCTRRLTQHVPNRGYRVIGLDAEQLTHLGELRAVLEAAIADRIYDRADAPALSRLMRLATQFEKEVRSGVSLLQRHAANLEFHFGLHALCPNPELQFAARAARERAPSALLYQWRTEAWVEQSIQDHFAMVEALRNKDRARLRDLFVQHLRVDRLAEAAQSAQPGERCR